LLIFGAHPDDIEFGCGGVVARETRAQRKVHFVVCSLGEAGTHGTPAQRAAEAEEAAALLGATIEFVELDGDAHLEIRAAHAIKLAEIIRRIRPATVLAPSCVENQHFDHTRLGTLVRDAARLARFGGLEELLAQAAHAIEQLFFYAITPEAEPRDVTPILIDVSAPEIVSAWTAAMNAHASQASTRNYLE
jgi:LmbE family N-acetylglucosaminyl deacetylase